MNSFNNEAIATDARMSCEQVLQQLAGHRRANQIVISNQMSARLWPMYSQHPRDLNYLSSTMGGAVPLGLGIALATPDCEVIVLSGDGSLLMNLGCLVSVAASRVTNVTIVLLDNGLYEVTGGQTTPGEQSHVDYCAVARATGFPSVAALTHFEDWCALLASGWDKIGPRFYALRVLPVDPATPRDSSRRVDLEIQRLRANLNSRGR